MVTSCGYCRLKKKKSIEFAEAFECESDYYTKKLWAVVAFPICAVISIKACKSIANFTYLLVQFLLYLVHWENLLVKNLSYSGRKIVKEAFGSHFL